MQIDVNTIVETIREEGYIRIENFIDAEVSKEIEDFMHSFNQNNYNRENLLERICFKREEGKNRQGDAYMVSLEDNKLGTIILDDGPVSDIFEFYNSILEKYVGRKMDDNSRAMLNCQQYFADEVILERTEVIEYLRQSDLSFDEREILKFIK